MLLPLLIPDLLSLSIGSGETPSLSSEGKHRSGSGWGRWMRGAEGDHLPDTVGIESCLPQPLEICREITYRSL